MPRSFLKRFRFEDFVDQLDTFMKANLNGYIQQMNLDKTDLTLKQVDAGAWFFQSLTGSDVPFNPFVFYGETGTATEANGPDEKSTFTLQVAVILANTNESSGTMGKRMLRYRDCLKAMFNDGWNSVNQRYKLNVTGISPFPFTLVNQDATHVGIGVQVEIEIA